jgi:predicted XRE-type DNA-binding protein
MVKFAFHELGLDKPDEMRKRNLTQVSAGEVLGLDQLNVFALMNEKISRFSLEKLMSLASKLGFTVSIHVEGHGVDVNVPLPAAT